MLYRIGLFSEINKVTVKTLRYYDETGLLKPAQVDRDTGYRYYATSQLPELHRILALRQIGFSIEEIREILDGTAQSELFERRRTELELVIEKSRQQISQIAHYLSAMKEDVVMDYEVLMKELPEVIVYSKRMKVTGYDEYFQLVPAIGEEVAAANPGLVCRTPEYCFIIYHDGEYRDRDIDMEYCEATESWGKDTETIRFKKMERVPEAACVMHRGPYENLRAAYGALFKWIEENDYIVADFPRESFIDGVWNKENPEDWITEVQVPVVRRYGGETDLRWGAADAYRQSQERMSQYSKPEWIGVMNQLKELMKRFAAIREEDPAGDAAQALVEEWKQQISNSMYNCTDVILQGLGEMYTADRRFTESIDEAGEGTAAFMSRAIAVYCGKK